MRSFLDELAADLRQTTKAKDDRPSSMQTFLEEEIRTDTGVWSLEGHEPLGEILRVMDEAVRKPKPDTEIVLLKAEQIGATLSMGIGPALHLAADLGRNVGYFLPTDKFAQKFGRTRLKRAIAKSQYLSDRMKDVGDPVNSATVKEFDGKFLYVLGLESMIGAISTPLDVLAYDEVDLLPAENREWSQGRVAHSDLRVSFWFSAGYSPGAGIDLKYQQGSQHKWLVDCKNRACMRKGICLEETFPECVRLNPAPIGDRYVRCCPDCKWPLNITRDGRWIATYPDRAKRGKISYRLSALAMDAMSADYIMNRWHGCRTKSQKAKFRCSALAIPDAGAMQPITDVEINKMQSGEVKLLRQDRGSLPRYAGMDAGDMCHFVCYERTRGGDPHLVWAEEIDSDVAFERITTLIGNLGVVQLVPDKKPLTNLARALAYRFPRIVAVQDFMNGSVLKVVDEEHEGKKYRCAKVDRDESLDELTSEFTDRHHFLRIPDLETNPVLETFASHLKNLRKERTIDAKGRAIDTYIKGVPNHFGMALNSARIAELIAPNVMPFEFTPIKREQGSSPLARPAEPRNIRGSLMRG